MKKIFILPMLIAPIVAHATDPVGPAHVNSGAVVATASAPYAIATPETGDTTNVVSASYVKGAYNDAIAAINKVASRTENIAADLTDLEDYVTDDKQDKLVNREEDVEIRDDVIGIAEFDEHMRLTALDMRDDNASNYDSRLVVAAGIAGGIIAAIDKRGVSAVTTWEDDNNTTVLDFVPNND